jgi:hypothetical protein
MIGACLATRITTRLDDLVDYSNARRPRKRNTPAELLTVRLNVLYIHETALRAWLYEC